MKFDPNFILKDVDGEPLKGIEDNVHAGKILARTMFYEQNAVDALKFHDWALKLYNKQPIDIDNSDMKILKDYISTPGKFPPITLIPILRLFDTTE